MIPSAFVSLHLALAAYRLRKPSLLLHSASMDGTCECGCGQLTRIAPKNDASKGWTKGQPLRFALGHNAALTNRPRRVLSPDDYTVEERGYNTQCWIWKGKPTGRRGYCRVGIDGHYEAAHRAYFERYVGQVPVGWDLHHRCEQHACVRPSHLEPMPHGEHIGLHKRKLDAESVTAIRAAAGVPLKELAARHGVSTNYVCSVRTGLVR